MIRKETIQEPKDEGKKVQSAIQRTIREAQREMKNEEHEKKCEYQSTAPAYHIRFPYLGCRQGYTHERVIQSCLIILQPVRQGDLSARSLPQTSF